MSQDFFDASVLQANNEAARIANEALMRDALPPGEQIAEDIPVATAYKVGRRIYVPCPARSPLDNQLFQLGAKFDRDEGCRYVGTGKLQAVLPLIREDLPRTTRRAEILTNDLTVDIPLRGGNPIREIAKQQHGAVFNGTQKLWHFPTSKDRDAVQALVDHAKTGRAVASKTVRDSRPSTSSTKCAECGRRGATHEAVDSSGLAGKVCTRCSQMHPHELSFA
jgi:hypothetical protein